MAADAQRQFVARMRGLDDALAFAEAFCLDAGIGAGDVLRLRLIVEELFTNTVVHGHRGGSDDRVVLALAADERQVRLDYEDGAPPFDPVRWLRESGHGDDGAPDEDQVGGLGLRLVSRLAARMTYAHESGRNRLRVVLARRAEPVDTGLA